MKIIDTRSVISITCVRAPPELNSPPTFSIKVAFRLALKETDPRPETGENPMYSMTFPAFASMAKGISISVLIVLTSALTAFAQSQSTTGTMQGTVLDANGAAVAGASVEIKNLDTNLSKTLTTDEGGRFVALTMPPGQYSISVSKTGFATAVAETI